MTATLPTHFPMGTPYPPSEEFLPTGRTPLGDYLTFFWLPRRLPGWAEGAAAGPGDVHVDAPRITDHLQLHQAAAKACDQRFGQFCPAKTTVGELQQGQVIRC